MISSIENLAARRDLAWELIRADLRSGSAENRLGWFWWILDPLLMIGVYWFFKVLVFGKDTYAPYPVFVGVALLTWRHLSTTAGKAVRVLRGSEAVIKSVPFPTAVLPITQSLSQFVYFSVSFGVLWLVAVLIGQEMTLTVLQIPLLALLQLILVTGIALALASFGAIVRDLEIATGHALRIGWYLSPGIYGVDLLVRRLVSFDSESLANMAIHAYMANPFAILFVGYRGAIFEPHWLEPVHWIVLTAEAAIAIAGGYWVFRHFDRRVIKFI
jgi:ABC-type polysaccharide/polyol phosphate export permease